jgi:hypothetical protein
MLCHPFYLHATAFPEVAPVRRRCLGISMPANQMDVVPRHIIVRRGLLCLVEHVLPMSFSSYGNAAAYDRVRDDDREGADLFSHSPIYSSYCNPAASK